MSRQGEIDDQQLLIHQNISGSKNHVGSLNCKRMISYNIKKNKTPGLVCLKYHSIVTELQKIKVI